MILKIAHFEQNTMTPEKQNIAIAETQGFRFVDEGALYPHLAEWQKYKAVYRGDGFIGLSTPDWTQIPDYARDRNAIHKAISSLKFSDKMRFSYCLMEVMSASLPEGEYVTPAWGVFASTEQLCEAFLKALEKWEEEVA